MPITFSCGCGRTLKVQDQFAGKRVKCPGCGGVAVAPAAAPAFEVVEDEPPAKAAFSAPAAKPAPARTRPARDEDEDERPRKKKPAEDDGGFEVVDEDEKPKKKPYKARADDDEDEDRPRKKKRADEDDEEEDRLRKKKKRRAPTRTESGDGSTRMGYIVGGLIAIAVGAAIAYFAYNSESRKSTSRMIGGIVVAVFGAVSVVRGITGNVEDDDDE